MPFRIVRNDITKMETTAIVNTANPQPIYSGGTDYAVYTAAGAEKLLAERQKIGAMTPGQSAVTPGFALPAKYIIHTVGPVWQGGDHGEADTLRACYRGCLQLAKKHRCKSIAFPLLATGVYGVPKDLALQIALSCFSEFLTREDMDIYLVVFGRSSLQLSQKLVADIDSYIDDHYVEEHLAEEYALSEDAPAFESRFSEPDLQAALEYEARLLRARLDKSESAKAFRPQSKGRGLPAAPQEEPALSRAVYDSEALPSPAVPSAKKPQASPRPKRSLDELLGQVDETFQEQLLRLIGERGLTNVEVYSRANLQKQLFAKIKKNKDYMPKKTTAMALCLALHLNLDEARDLLAKAGYTFSPSSKVDLVVQYFIEQKVYDVITVDCALFDHDLPPLSNYPSDDI